MISIDKKKEITDLQFAVNLQRALKHITSFCVFLLDLCVALSEGFYDLFSILYQGIENLNIDNYKTEI